MVDDVDQTTEHADYVTQINLHKSRKTEPRIKKPTGKCLNCGTKIYDRRWCNAQCRDQWERTCKTI